MPQKHLPLMLALGLASTLASAPSLEEQVKALQEQVNAMETHHAQDKKSAGLQIWVQATGNYANTVGGGNDAAGVAVNRGKATSILDLGAQGKPVEGMDASAVFRVNSAGQLEVWDVWAEQALFGGLSVRGGFLDLTGIFDASGIANDEKTQFVRSEFVDNPALGNGSNALGGRLHWQAGEKLYAQAAVQALNGASDPADHLYSIAEMGTSIGGSDIKLWAREKGRSKQAPVGAYGLVLDQSLGKGLILGLRWAQEPGATGLEHGASGAYTANPLNSGGASGTAPFVTAQAGLQWTGLVPAHPLDKMGLAWGTQRACDTSAKDYAEAYYACVINENVLLSLHYQTDYSRLQQAVSHDWDGDSTVDSTTYTALETSHQLAVRVNLAY